MTKLSVAVLESEESLAYYASLAPVVTALGSDSRSCQDQVKSFKYGLRKWWTAESMRTLVITVASTFKEKP